MALVRVKRRAQDDPVDLLLVACKKSKVSVNNEEDSAEIEEKSAVFKFTATVSSEKSDDFKSHISRILSSDVKLPFKGRQNDVDTLLEKIRGDHKSLSKNNRFKVVNCFRAVDTDLYAEALSPSSSPHQERGDKTLTIVDIESTPPVAATTASHEAPKGSDNSETTSEQFVYDLYYSKVADLDDLLLEKMLSVHEVDERLLFDNDEDDEDNVMDDEDDSNDEGNWRNDYPDEDPDDDDDDKSSRSTISEEHMRLAAKLTNMNFDGSYSSDLSTDRDDDDLIYGVDDYDRHSPWAASDDDD